MVFWIAALLLAAICAAMILAALRTPPEDTTPDVEIYRDQLAEIDRDVARGVVPEAEAETARAEIARRLLAANRDAGTRPGGVRGNGPVAGILIAATVLGVSAATYAAIGAPGYGDMPLADRVARIETDRRARPGQAVAEAEVPNQIDNSRPDVTQLAAQLRQVLVDRPNDLRGWELAANTESGLGDYEAAWRAQDRVIAIKGDDAVGEDFSYLAELMILAAAGYVSPEAERALAEALRLDPTNGAARYYVGLMYAQGGRPDLAWPIWRRLVGDSAPDAPWLPAIYSQIEQVSSAAGDPTRLDELPTPRAASALPGGPMPTQEDVEAMSALSLEDRMAQIEGMVGGLAARLAADGGPPEDWARLITAYGVLGRLNDASTIYEEAKLVFAGDQGALDILAAGADRAGLAP